MKTLTDPRIQTPNHDDPELCVKSHEVVMCERCGAVIAAPPGIPIHEAWHARIDGSECGPVGRQSPADPHPTGST